MVRSLLKKLLGKKTVASNTISIIPPTSAPTGATFTVAGPTGASGTNGIIYNGTAATSYTSMGMIYSSAAPTTTYTTANVTWQGSNWNGHADIQAENAHLSGDVIIKGKSLTTTLSGVSDSLAKIEQRLAIIHENPGMEEKWEELRKLGDEYRRVEAEILSKEKVWKILQD